MQEANAVWFGDEAIEQLQDILDSSDFSRVFFLVDENTHEKCLPYLIRSIGQLPEYEILEVEAGEDSKSIEVLAQLWMALSDLKADRSALIVNVGGGMITDLGGFMAGTYLRGVAYVNFPTSLLAMVDASSGGKTGINLKYLKNRVGLFLNPLSTLILPEFLETLSARERLSGFAEMLKHALIADQGYWQQLTAFDIENDSPDAALIKKSVEIKQDVVSRDFREEGLRKVLNFGHTVGHALETYTLQGFDPLLHGEAVAIGMMVELVLSERYTALDPNTVSEVNQYLKSLYPIPKLEWDWETILSIMQKDKKNMNGEVRFVLLKAVGEPQIDVNVGSEAILEALKAVLNS